MIALVASHIQPWNTPAFRPMRTFVLLELAALALAYLVVTRAKLRLLPGSLVTAAFTLLALLSVTWSPDPSLTVDRAVGFAALVVAAAALALGAVDRPRVASQLMLALLAATTLIAARVSWSSGTPTTRLCSPRRRGRARATTASARTRTRSRC